MTSTSIIRHDLTVSKALFSEWKEKSAIDNLAHRIGQIQTEAIRSYTAAKFVLFVQQPQRAEFLQLVQPIDPALFTELNKAHPTDVKQLSTPSIQAYKELKYNYGGNRDADWISHIPETFISLFVSIPMGMGWSMYAATVTVMGVGASLASAITGGTKKEINECADDWTQYARSIVADPYRFLWTASMPKVAKEERENVGVITRKVAIPIFVQAQVEARQSDFLHRHIISRSLFLIAGLVAIVSRAVDFSLGCGAAAVSILPCLLVSRRINTFAYVQLKSLGVIYDVTAALRGTINPQQFLK